MKSRRLVMPHIEMRNVSGSQMKMIEPWSCGVRRSQWYCKPYIDLQTPHTSHSESSILRKIVRANPAGRQLCNRGCATGDWRRGCLTEIEGCTKDHGDSANDHYSIRASFYRSQLAHLVHNCPKPQVFGRQCSSCCQFHWVFMRNSERDRARVAC